MDSNVTTLIAAAVLYQFGTGPIKGFAVTLSLGIIASLFTALFLSKLIFDILLTNKPSLKLSI
jgi:preprotein translocase subunit SecD